MKGYRSAPYTFQHEAGKLPYVHIETIVTPDMVKLLPVGIYSDYSLGQLIIANQFGIISDSKLYQIAPTQIKKNAVPNIGAQPSGCPFPVESDAKDWTYEYAIYRRMRILCGGFDDGEFTLTPEEMKTAPWARETTSPDGDK